MNLDHLRIDLSTRNAFPNLDASPSQAFQPPPSLSSLLRSAAMDKLSDGGQASEPPRIYNPPIPPIPEDIPPAPPYSPPAASTYEVTEEDRNSYPEEWHSSDVFGTEDPASNDTSVTGIVRTEGVSASAEDIVPVQTFVVSFADGESVTVTVNGKTLDEAGTLVWKFGDVVASSAPAVRKTLIEGPPIIISDIVSDIEGQDTLAYVRRTLPPADDPFRENGITFLELVIDSEYLKTNSLDETRDVLLHEIGHLVSPYNEIQGDTTWVFAMADDGVSSSNYAETSWQEDYAETFVVWHQVRSGEITGEDAALLEDLFGHRFILLDNNLAAVETLEPDAALKTPAGYYAAVDAYYEAYPEYQAKYEADLAQYEKDRAAYDVAITEVIHELYGPDADPAAYYAGSPDAVYTLVAVFRNISPPQPPEFTKPFWA